MAEKIVNVPVRMTLEGSIVVAVDAKGTRWHESAWFDEMHAAAEELRAQGASERVGGRCHHCGHYETSLQRAEEKYAHCPSCERHTRWLPVHDGAEGAELGENQWRCESGLVCTFSDATEDGITLSWSDDVAPKHHKLADVTRHGLKEAAERWHAKNRPLLPDECREQGKPPRKMAAGEIRLLDGSPGLLGIGSARENPTIYVRGVGFHHTLHELLDKSEGPFIDTTQRDRAFAWFLTQLLSDLCLTDDGRSVRTMATNEVRDVVTGKGLAMHLGATGYHSDEDSVFVHAPERGAHYCYATENPPADSPFSLPSNRLRVEAFLEASAKAKTPDDFIRAGQNPGLARYEDELRTRNGTGRKTEDSDGKNNTLESRAGDQVRLGGFTAEDRRSETSGLFPVSPLAASGQTEGAGAAERPPGVPASATIWAEVEVVTRCAAWFEPRKNQWCPAGVVLDNPTGGNFWTPENSDNYWHPQTALQCRQLYEKGLAHLAAEATPKPALTAVDLTELREAWNDYMPGLTPLPERIRPIIAAVESLLSDGAP